MSDTKPGTITAIKAIKDYFFAGEPTQTVLTEMKKLTPEDKAVLAEGAAKELGKTLVTKVE